MCSSFNELHAIIVILHGELNVNYFTWYKCNCYSIWRQFVISVHKTYTLADVIAFHIVNCFEGLERRVALARARQEFNPWLLRIKGSRANELSLKNLIFERDYV